MPTDPCYSTEAPESPLNILCCGDAGKLPHGTTEPPSDAPTSLEEHRGAVAAPIYTTPPTIKPYGADAIPTLEADSLLASVRGRWRRPRTLRREDFEATFRQQARAVVTFEDVLARIRAGIFNRPADLARYYGKQPSWVSSLMFCCLRDGVVSDMKTWQAYFPKKHRTMQKREARAT